MEVCYQLPVLPLDRPVPQHVLSRRGAISFSSSSALFGCPHPRQLSQVTAAPGPAARCFCLLEGLGPLFPPRKAGLSFPEPFALGCARCPWPLRPSPRLTRHARC